MFVTVRYTNQSARRCEGEMSDDQADAVVTALQRRLALLRERAAKEGAHTDPAVQIEIEDITAQLRDLGAPISLPARQQRPWWASLADGARGDVIVGQIGAGAQNVAVGKAIQQIIGADAGASDDRATLETQLGALEQAARNAAFDESTGAMVTFQVGLLRGELLKRDDAPPSASTLTQVGEWLCTNAAPLREPLAALFTSGAGWRLLARAGNDAVTWAARRFDEPA